MGNYSVPKNRKRGNKGRVIVDNPLLSFITYVCVFLIGVLLAGMLALKLYLMSLPPIKNLNSLKPNIVTTFCAGDGEVIKTFTAFKFEKVSIDKIPEYLKQAVIATEDKNFYRHREIGRAHV